MYTSIYVTMLHHTIHSNPNSNPNVNPNPNPNLNPKPYTSPKPKRKIYSELYTCPVDSQQREPTVVIRAGATLLAITEALRPSFSIIQ